MGQVPDPYQAQCACTMQVDTFTEAGGIAVQGDAQRDHTTKAPILIKHTLVSVF